MAQSFKIEDEIYLDSSSITYNQKKLCDILYPVGSIYLSTNSTSPKTLFGGTWSRLKGGFLYGATSGSTYSTGNGTGTSTNDHTLTIDEMPSHNHTLVNTNTGGYSYDYTDYSAECGGAKGYDGNVWTAYTGGGQGHSHDIPYIAVFMWRRTS